jgi:hypothetical protein
VLVSNFCLLKGNLHQLYFINFKTIQMKKTILSIAAMALTSASLFAQIPNAGFENWTTVGAYSVPNGWGTLNNSTTLAGVYTATAGTPGSPGASYLKLTSKTIPSVGVANGIAVSGVLDSTTMQPKSGFAFNQRPANLTGKWQHMIYGTSQGSIMITLTRWDSGMGMRMPVASGSVTLSGMAMSWTTFTVPLTYSDGNNPDSCIIVLKASGSTPTNNDYLWVDNLAFSGTVTGLKNQESIFSNVNVFPNPSAETVNVNLNLKSEQKVSLELVDLTGKLVASKDLGIIQGDSKQVINVNGITKGTYFVRVVTEKGTEVKKIIIE